MEKHGTVRQATDVNTIRPMRFACRINKATDRLRECNTYCFSTNKNGYSKAPQYYVTLFTVKSGYT